QVTERVANCCHFPVQNADHPRLGFVEDQVVDLVVAVHECATVFGLGFWIAEKGDHLVKVWDVADWYARVFVFCLGLCRFKSGKGLQLTVVEARGFAELAEANVGRLYTVEFCESSHCVTPPIKDCQQTASRLKAW